MLRAYIEPGVACLLESEELRMTRTQVMGRCRMEPAPLQQRAAEQFGRGNHQFVALLQQVLPDKPKAELSWKLDMVMTHLSPRAD